MRILRLDLRRYGPFTDAHVHFRAQAKLHLVYGANEAGKSSALAAIGDLLFGFPHAKQQDFLHEAGSLRVGAELVSRNGAFLRFRRRRGNKNTILADEHDETALPDDALLPYVGALGREVFARAFGLDSHALRAGGQAMLESEGEVGSALFAAASGLTDLARVRRGLEAEADQIFAPRASKDRRFYQALDRYQTALKSERENELKSGDWRRLNAEIDGIEAEIEAIRARRLETTQALDRLKRLKQLAPIVGAIDRDTEALADFADLPELPAGFGSEARVAMAAAATAEAETQMAEQARIAAAAALTEIAVDEKLLARADTVVELFSRRGDYISKIQDRPRIERERDDFTDQLAAQAGRLGLKSLVDMVAAIPGELAIEEGKALLAAGRRLEESIEAEEERLRGELATAQAQEAEHAASGLSDPKPLRDQLAALAPDLKQLEARDYLEGRLRELRGKLEDGARRLLPPVADLDRLAHVPLPSRAAIDAHRTTLGRLAERQRTEADRLAANAAEHESVASQLRELGPAGPIAYEEELRVARDERDRNFARLRERLMSAAHRPTFAEADAQLGQVEQLSAAADALADQAIADAHRSSRLSGLRQRLAALEAERGEQEAARSVLQHQQAAAEQGFVELFAAVKVTPGPPEAMLEWLGVVDSLLAIRRDAQALEGQISSLDRLVGEVHAALLPLAALAGAADAGALAPLALSRLIASNTDEMAERWSARLSLEGMRRATRIRIGQIEETLGKLRREREAGKVAFQAMLEAIHLPPDSSLVAAGVALAAWEAVPDLNREWANRAARVDGMIRDIAVFEDEVRTLAGDLAPALADLSPPALIDRLREGAEVARAAMARRDDARQRLAAAEAAVLAARTAEEQARSRLDGLLAALPPGADSTALVDRLDRRETLRHHLDALQADFRAGADGMEEAAIRQALEDYDPARGPLDAEDLERQSDALHVENNRLYAQLGQKQAERERLEAGSGSELAAFERRGAEVEIVANARQWAVRRIAATMLAGAIERYRDAQSDPLMARAGTLFAAITQGSFSGLTQDYDEDDRPSLVGVRPDGARLKVTGMSEGARDQLYLALRLAYIEDYAGRAEPVPFIGDDIFQTFDDDRTAAGISALAAGSKAFQPILFTHHLSVVAIARRVLGGDLDYIEL